MHSGTRRTSKNVDDLDTLTNRSPTGGNVADSTASPDDPYEHSDEALPGDEEERSIAQDPYREEGRFGETEGTNSDRE